MNCNQNSLGIDLKYYGTLAERHCGNIFNEISDYQIKDYPSRPGEFITYYSQNASGRKASDERGFWRKDYIVEYLEKKWKVGVHHKSCFIKLYHLLKDERAWPLGNGGDIKAKQAILIKLSQFKQKILSNQYQYEACKIDFKEFPFNEVSNKPQVDWQN